MVGKLTMAYSSCTSRNTPNTFIPLANLPNDNTSILGGIRLLLLVMVVGGRTAPPPSGNVDVIANDD